MIDVLVVGQTPPPFHGQSLMFERLLRAQFDRVRMHHVRMAFSGSIDEVGRFRLGKMFHLLGVVARIIYGRFAYNAKVLYYPPAGPNRIPLYRDLAILLCTRWLFRHTIFHFHAGGVSQLYGRLSRPMRVLFRLAMYRPDIAIRVSHGAPPDAQAVLARREVVVHNGIEDEGARFRQEGTSAAATTETRPPRILSVGNLCEQKGVLVLLDACGRLAARGISFELEFVGQFHSNEFEAIVKQRINELGLEGRVRFAGVLSGAEKWSAFASADIFCFPTFHEGESFGIVLLEAMSFSLPVVATRWHGIPEVVDDGVTGFLVPEKDSVAMADRLEQFIADPALRRTFGAAGRTKFLREFTVDRYWRRMEEIFKQTVGEK